ncbi:MAG: choice-of-anchor tandem repeat GloVer-containing protein [Planctomycetota bacterium]
MNTHTPIFRNKIYAVVATLIAIVVNPSVGFAQPQFMSIHSFNGTDGFGPMAGVVQGDDGALYGTTSGQVDNPIVGTVFRLDLATPGLTTLHYFADGSRPFSGLTLGSDGLLYGSTYTGGKADLGTLFRVGPDGQNFASLYSFSGVDGARPDDLKLTQAGDGVFYGATSEGGPEGGGTLFRLDPATQVLTTMYSFSAVAGVDAGLVAGRDGFWYGTTYSGGANGVGSVFRVDPSTFQLTTLYDFTGADGANPVPGALMQSSDGNLYGTTQLGGNGTVFKLNPATLALTTLHVFSGINDGRFPLGGVTEGGDGYIYGTTVLGGQGYGTVYRVHPTTFGYNIVVWFGGTNGRSPSGNLFRASDGALYGVTRLGGSFNGGTVFRLSFADTTPPTITSITASPSVLWPPNGRMVPVTLKVAAADAVDPAPRSRIIGVTCNQRAAGYWMITGDLTLKLRAIRTGHAARIYTITVQCTDASGNSALGTVNVTVPK